MDAISVVEERWRQQLLGASGATEALPEPPDPWRTGQGLQALPDWLPRMWGDQGIVVDQGQARDVGPCLKVELGDDRAPLVYRRGIIGSLSSEQQELYCQDGTTDAPLSGEERERIVALSTGAESCGAQVADVTDVGEKVSEFYSCLALELKAQGLPL